MKSIPVIRSSLLAPFEGFMRRYGMPIDSIFHASRIPGEARDDRDLIIPERPVWRMLELLGEREHMPDIGFRIGSQIHISDVPELYAELAKAKTLAELLRRHARISRAFANTSVNSLVLKRDKAWFCRNPSPIDCGQWPMEQLVLSVLINIIRQALGPRWWPRSIGLIYGGCLNREERGWLQHSHVRQGCRMTSVSLSREELRTPVYLGAEPSCQAEDTDMPASIGDTVAALLPFYIEGKSLRLDRFCADLSVPSRTLQHWLHEEGTSFQELSDQVRFQQAKELLDSSDLRIADIAKTVGYKDANAFSRGFKRVCGLSPRQFRSSYSQLAS